ncbi:MAG TPA: phosphoribosylanthranilate isomerase [Gemmatimonadaceae bacterium]|nr:phosphoribosylanthranilate isomerase [Gemmatimonadaceae bacterium]
MTEIKFCGLTRHIDVEVATQLGAAFVGAVFADGPRRVTAEQARMLFGDVTGARKVGVFADQSVDEIARTAELASLDVVQLHADPTPAAVDAVKTATGLETWAAMRISNAPSEEDLDGLISSADAILFDTRSGKALGGTGSAFDWALLTNLLDQHRRGRARVVLAGGLNPTLVPRAIAAVHPDIVDVSSGVEVAPGVKDHRLMRAFTEAVRSAP